MYSRYSNPKELISLYIKGKRFGKLVEKVIASESERKKKEAEKENEQKLWMMYVHSMQSKSFNDWKEEVLKPSNNVTGKKDINMTESDIEGIIHKLFPGR